jgi:hypothetical protein
MPTLGKWNTLNPSGHNNRKSSSPRSTVSQVSVIAKTSKSLLAKKFVMTADLLFTDPALIRPM